MKKTTKKVSANTASSNISGVNITSSLQGMTLSNAGNHYIHIEDGQTFGQSTTSSGTFIIQDTKKLIDSKFIEKKGENLIEMTYEIVPYPYITTISTTGVFSEPRKNLLKEVYGVKDGQLQLLKSIKGVENPGYYVPPATEWEE